ncbi:nucleotide kinase [Lithospermum erythrorhizon]|uniref:UMP kinase n=1 Tax=Lithospermum erythrorhizon TaxID=34254 RepID=A0AAV3RBT1_LITER
MASCEDDFTLLGDQNDVVSPLHDQFSDNALTTPPSYHVINPYDSGRVDPSKNRVNDKRMDREEEYAYEMGRIRPDPNKKRVDRDEASDSTTPYSYNKKFRVNSSSIGGEYRKDREEWSDTAIGCLLEAYTEKFVELNRGNLRGRDWEEVAVMVSEGCDKQSKSVEQCKNKVDNLKKRFKLERHRLSNGGISASHWPWFKQMEAIVGKGGVGGDEEKPNGGSGMVTRQSKRYGATVANGSALINIVKPKPTPILRWRRVVFKISGAALAGGETPHNIDPKVAMLVAREVSTACRLGVEVAIVVGGRNFFCGDTWVNSTGLDRSTAYHIGMMATVMNSILLQSAFEKLGVQTRVQSTFSMPEFAEPYNRQRAIRHLEKGRVVIFGGIGAGTGNPLFSTDTAAALRASEIHADALLKGTNLDDIYVCDSRSGGITTEHISFKELNSRDASPMELMAVSYCEENGISVVIFNLHEPGNISRALTGEQVGTLIDQTGNVG